MPTDKDFTRRRQRQKACLAIGLELVLSGYCFAHVPTAENALAAGISSMAAAAGRRASCTRSNPDVTGRCYSVHGVAEPSADVGMVLGTQNGKTLVLWPPGGTEDYAPPDVEGPLGTMKASVDSEFEVCPLPEQPTQFEKGFLHFVCISKAYDIKIHWD